MFNFLKVFRPPYLRCLSSSIAILSLNSLFNLSLSFLHTDDIESNHPLSTALKVSQTIGRATPHSLLNSKNCSISALIRGLYKSSLISVLFNDQFGPLSSPLRLEKLQATQEWSDKVFVPISTESQV